MKKSLTGDKAAIKRYGDLLSDIKTRIRQAQNRAVMSANAEMLHLYWDIGRMVTTKQEVEGWGAAVIPRLAVDLRSDMPEINGFSERNIRRMVQFYKEYQNFFSIRPRPVAKLYDSSVAPEIRPQPVAKLEMDDTLSAAQTEEENHDPQRVVAHLPWAHNVILIQKVHWSSGTENRTVQTGIRRQDQFLLQCGGRPIPARNR